MKEDSGGASLDAEGQGGGTAAPPRSLSRADRRERWFSARTRVGLCCLQVTPSIQAPGREADATTCFKARVADGQVRPHTCSRHLQETCCSLWSFDEMAHQASVQQMFHRMPITPFNLLHEVDPKTATIRWMCTSLAVFMQPGEEIAIILLLDYL